RLSGLGDITPPDCRRAIPLTVNGLKHRLDPFSKAFLRRLHRLPIHPDRRTVRNPCKIPLHSVTRDVMGKRRKAELRLTPSFRFYAVKFCFHGQLYLSIT
ncbi:hypothetical protein, partial [Sinorhizobium fredii]|uniref:hypothetical protein n=1 Tax=Rhizobium fredii TaxID=380 RepID=UPI001AEC0689